MKLGKIINSGIPIFGGALLVVIVGLTFLQIVLRQFFDYTFNWSDEVSQFSMTWMALFGSIWCAKNNNHLNTGLRIHEKLGGRLVHLIDAALALIIVIISLVVAYHCAIFTSVQWTMESLSLPWLKIGYVFIALPIAMLAASYYYFKSFIKNLSLLFKKD